MYYDATNSANICNDTLQPSRKSLLRFLPLVELYEPTPAPNTVPADPDDEIFIECALSASATLLVSGDSHLLRLKRHGRISIVSPVEFLHQIQTEKR